jgi:hypothetical protein
MISIAGGQIADHALNDFQKLAEGWRFGMSSLEVLGDLFEGFQRRALTPVQCRDGVFQAVIDVILDQRALGLAYGFFHRMQLLGNVHALAPFFDHDDDTAQMTICSLEALDDRFMTLVGMGMAGFVFITHDLGLGPQ